MKNSMVLMVPGFDRNFQFHVQGCHPFRTHALRTEDLILRTDNRLLFPCPENINDYFCVSKCTKPFFNKMEETEKYNQREDIFSKAIRAGKRTYFFDVKETRAQERYLTITESKKRFDNDSGKFFYEKHKIFLYQEDFYKFMEGLQESMEFISADSEPPYHRDSKPATGIEEEIKNVKFEDLEGEVDEPVSDEADKV
jgi:hypothetical protein